jgi:hypothetical protein
MALNDGYDFKRVVLAMGDDGMRVAFQCLLAGYIDRGELTDKGRAKLAHGSEA